MRPKALLTVLPLAALVMSVFSGGPACSQQDLMAKAEDRVFSEALFAAAYREALDGRVGKALLTLEESLRWDPYLVEYYLLKGYSLYLAGDFLQAMENVGLYLEVRRKDPFATGFLKQIEERMSFVEKSLETGIRTTSGATPSKYLWDRLGIKMSSKGFFTMPGRPSQIGDLLAFCDSSREMVHLYERGGEGGWTKVFSGSSEGEVVRALPLDRERIYLVFADGSVAHAMLSRSGFIEISRSEGTALAVSDAALANASLLILADRVAGDILFVDTGSGDVLDRWSPAGGAFEPVSVSVLGPLLAVGDRLGRKTWIVDLSEASERAQFTVPGSVRSVEWINSEKVIVLTEEGDVFEISLSAGKTSLIGRAFPEAWFLFRSGNNVLVTDTRLYRSSSVFVCSDRGILVLEEPKASGEIDETKPFSVSAKVLRPLGGAGDPEMLFQGLLGGRFLEASIIRSSTGINRPDATHLSGASKTLWETDDISELPDSILVTVSDLPGETDLVKRLGFFAMARGMTVHVLAENDMPTLSQVRLAEMTGGSVVMSENNMGDLYGPERWEINLQVDGRILMIGDVDGGGGLFLIGRAGPMAFEDRFPLWRVFVSSREKDPPRGDVVSGDVISGP